MLSPLALRLAGAGEAHLAEGRLSEAASAFRAALDLLTDDDVPATSGRRDEVHRLVSQLRTALGTTSFVDGDPVTALDWFRQALEGDESTGAPPATIARDLCNIGVVQRQVGELDAALAAYRRALDLERAAGVEACDIAVTVNNIGMVHRSTGDPDSALRHFEEALAMLPADDPEVARRRASVISNIAGVHLDRGAFADAMAGYRQALDIASGAAPVSRDVAKYHNNLGYVFRLIGDHPRALDQYQRALQLDRRLNPRSLEAARDLINIAGIHRDDGDHDAARRKYEQARRVLRPMAPRSPEMSACLTNLGGLRDLAGDLDGALRYYRRALAIDEALSPVSTDVAANLSNIADVLLSRGRLDEALVHARRAVEIDRSLGPQSLATATSLYNIAVIHRRRGDPDAAISAAEQSLATAESLRLRAGGDWAREHAFRHHESAYAAVVGWRWERAQAADHELAFHAAERSRARVLLDLISARRVGPSPTGAGQRRLLEREQDLADRLAGAHAAWVLANRDGDADAAEQWAVRRHELAEQSDRLWAEMQATFPRYAAVHAPSSADVATVQRWLRPDELLLAYLVTDTGTFRWSLRRRGFRMSRLAVPQSRLDALVEAATGPFRESRVQDDSSRSAHHELSGLLLGGVPPDLRDGARRLTIVPGGGLAYLPFELLPVDGDELLVDRYAVSYCPSATVLAELRRRVRPAARSWRGRQFIGFAGPRPRPGTTADGPGAAMSPLPGAEREVTRVAAAFGADAACFVGPDVTRERLLRSTTGYRYVHFASHALLDDDDPLYSGLVIAADDEVPGSGRDGLFQVYEMFRLRLRAEVVVCSACQTALGPIRAGEGVVGMSRALLAAGARAVALTLWPVPDGPTARLIDHFYAGLRAEQSPAQALAEAKRALRRHASGRYADPWLWAGLVVIGAG